MVWPILGFLARHWVATSGVAAAGWAYRDELKNKGVEALKDPKGTATAVIEGTSTAIRTTGETIDQTRKMAEGVGSTAGKVIAQGKKIGEDLGIVGSDSSASNGEDKGINWLKILGIGGGTAGTLWGLTKLFSGGNDSKEKNSNDGGGFSFGSLFTTVLVGLAAVLAFKNWDFIKDKFHEVTGNRFNSDTPSVAQRLTSDPTGRTSTAALTPPTPTTPLAKEFAPVQDPKALAQKTMNTAAGRPVRATVEGPVRTGNATVEATEDLTAG